MKSRAAGRAAAALAIGLALLWLAAVTGSAVPEALGRAMALAFVAALATWMALRLFTTDEPGAAGSRRERRILFLLVAVALAIRLVGLDYGVAERFNTDEGMYTNRVAAIARGELLFSNFIYPHLVFYLHGFAAWVVGLFSAPAAALVHAVWGLDERFLTRFVLRLVTALLGALTVWPTFRIARRLLDLRAAVLAGLLLGFSTLHNDGSHNATTDIPAAFFATLSLMFAARLLDSTSPRDYVLAGLAAGLAAGCKYPAGVVALAILVVWLRQTLQESRLVPGLAWATLAALAAFLASTPSLLVLHEQVFGGRNSLLFGLEGYSGTAWPGVASRNTLLSYLGWVSDSLGLPAVLAGLAGLAVLDPAARLRLLWLLPFPVASIALISSVNVIVQRNLYPVFPALAALVGVGLSAAAARLERAQTRRLAPLLLAASLALPVTRTLRQAVRFASPDTREIAAAWIAERLPLGLAVVAETYTPSLPRRSFALRSQRYAASIPFAELEQADVLLLSSLAHGRFYLDSDIPYLPAFRRTYARIFTAFPVLREFRPSWRNMGPVITLREVVPGDMSPARWRLFTAAEGFYPSPSMDGGDGTVRYVRPGQWTALSDFLAEGEYVAQIAGEVVAPAWLDVTSLDGEMYSSYEVGRDGQAHIRIPYDGKFVLHVRLAVGSVLRELCLSPADGRRG